MQSGFVRLIPAAPYRSITINGRTYSCAAGSAIDVPFFDAPIMTANGWCQICAVGPTSARPTAPTFNQFFHDTTLGLTIVWEGAAWRNPANGSAV